MEEVEDGEGEGEGIEEAEEEGEGSGVQGIRELPGPVYYLPSTERRWVEGKR